MSTMLLQIRRSSQDIDFLSEALGHEITDLLQEASQYVRRQMTGPELGSGSFHNRATVSISTEARWCWWRRVCRRCPCL